MKSNPFISLFHTVLDFFYPPFCFDCGGKVENRAYLCEFCHSLIHREPVPLKEQASNHHLDSIFSCYDFEIPLVRTAIHALKYSGIPGPSCELLARRLPAIEISVYDYVVPVPLHWRRFLKRGYNQAEILAKVLVREGKARELISPLRRKRFTKTQTKKSRWERKGAMREVFGMKKKYPNLVGKTVLIVDDVCTTGSTAKGCAPLLKHAGANRVDLFTLGKA